MKLAMLVLWRVCWKLEWEHNTYLNLKSVYYVVRKKSTETTLNKLSYLAGNSNFNGREPFMHLAQIILTRQNNSIILITDNQISKIWSRLCISYVSST